MRISDEISGALEEMENDLADESGETQKLTLPSGTELPCVPSMEEVGNEVAIGNLVQVISAVVRVRKSYFVTADMTTITVDSEVLLSDNDYARPRTGKKPTFRNKVYRVLKVQESPCMAYLKVFLGSAK